MRSLQLTSDHSMPTAASAQTSTGRPPAADITSRRTEATSSVGTSAMSQSTIRMEVAEVDHGSDYRDRRCQPVGDLAEPRQVHARLHEA